MQVDGRPGAATEAPPRRLAGAPGSAREAVEVPPEKHRAQDASDVWSELHDSNLGSLRQLAAHPDECCDKRSRGIFGLLRQDWDAKSTSTVSMEKADEDNKEVTKKMKMGRNKIQEPTKETRTTVQRKLGKLRLLG